MRRGYYKNYQKRSKKIVVLIISLVALVCLFHAVEKSGWKLFGVEITEQKSEEQWRNEFDEKMYQWFQEEVSSDTITRNYTLKQPEKYGLSKLTPTFGDFSVENREWERVVAENRLVTLKNIPPSMLNQERKITYDVVKEMLEQEMEALDMLYYTEVLSPTTGTHVQLPVIMSEYHFWDINAVEEYIELLQKFPSYFAQIEKFEREKAQKGLFMTKKSAKIVVQQCQEFIKNPESNLLVSTFKNRLSALSLSAEVSQKLIEKNEKAVKEKVLPAYQHLITVLEECAKKSVNQKGLAGFPNGKTYYQYLLKAKVGTGRDIKKIDALLERTIQDCVKDMSACMVSDEKIYEKASQVKYPEEQPEKMMRYLQEKCKESFPEIDTDIQCTVKYVDASLENSMSPAFYLTAPIDDYKNNVVYINGSKNYDLSKIFTTIAHETFPGHLYQNAYYHSLKTAPIRSMISMGGYTEGWGTYGEVYSYAYAGLSPSLEKFMRANTILTLAIYGKADLMIHAYGWTEKQLQLYLQDFGMDKRAATAIFDSVVSEPAGYMQYTLGYLEIEELKKKAKKSWGRGYTEKEFHTFFLSVGEAPFYTIESYVNQWKK